MVQTLTREEVKLQNFRRRVYDDIFGPHCGGPINYALTRFNSSNPKAESRARSEAERVKRYIGAQDGLKAKGPYVRSAQLPCGQQDKEFYMEVTSPILNPALN